MKVPYAKSDFSAIRAEGYFYVDKTPFIKHIEDTTADHLIFLRPRRFGKSTLLSTLANYYDLAKAGEFDKLFGGLWIHAHPTPKKNAYLVLKLDFSPVASEGSTAEIRASFAGQVKDGIRPFVLQYMTLIPDLLEVFEVVRSDSVDVSALMTKLFSIVRAAGYKIYLLIDEYDHFGNRLLSDGNISTYQELVQASGFLRSFYAALKAATTPNTLARTLITGVSPIMLDDLSSGFNIVTHVSQRPIFNEMVGFTHADVERAVDMLVAYNPSLSGDPRIADRTLLMSTLQEHYDGYRFAADAGQRMYNSTLVLYFLDEILANGYYPRTMLDWNARTDYGRLYRIAEAASGKADGTRELLEEVLSKGSVSSPLVERFGTRIPFAKAQVASLFYYMGMLTFGPDADKEIIPTLVIPNRVMRELQWEYMSYALADHDRIVIDMSDVELSLSKMAKHGDIEPLLDVFREQVLSRISNKDLVKFNEKIMKLMLLSYLCQTRVFNVVSEIETAQGYCDLLLGLRSATMLEKYAWIIEAKYVKTGAKGESLATAVNQGYAQIEKYMSDQGVVQMLTLGREIKAGVMVFVGAKKIEWYPWPKETSPGTAKKPATKKPATKKAMTTRKTGRG